MAYNSSRVNLLKQCDGLTDLVTELQYLLLICLAEMFLSVVTWKHDSVYRLIVPVLTLHSTNFCTRYLNL